MTGGKESRPLVNQAEPAPIIPGVFRGFPLKAGFTTRAGGVSTEPYASLNLGRRTGDDPSTVEENHRILFTFLGADPRRAADMRQVHGTAVGVAREGGTFPDTDALVTDVPGVFIGVRTADCVPLLLYDPRCHAAGAVHCGWRSLTGNIAEKALAVMAERSGCAAGDVRAAIGPAAGVCCYEVGCDVADLLPPEHVERRGETLFADLKGELITRLRAAGLADTHIETSPRCTICEPGLFYSHRRDGKRSGRQMGYVVLGTV